MAELSIDGFEITDLSEEVPTEEYVKKGEEVGAGIVAMGGLITSSMFHQGVLVDPLIERGIKNK